VKSFKKVLGSIGCGVVWFVSVYAVIMDVTLTIQILTANIGLVIALFGIKTWSGLQSKKIDGNTPVT
jgi:hypothetical protein